MLHNMWNAAVAGSMLLVCYPFLKIIIIIIIVALCLLVKKSPLCVGSLAMVPNATFASISSGLATILATSRNEGRVSRL